MKANQINFGVEVETHVPQSANYVGGYSDPTQVPWLPHGWKCGHDSSIMQDAPTALYRTRQSAEFVSPILVGEDGLREAYQSIKKIQEADTKVRKQCGVHVTITFPADNASALARLICFFAQHEKGLYASTGTTDRENGRWAKSLRKSAEQARKKDKAEVAKNNASYDRYHALNLTHMAMGRNRVEFRLFSASTCPTKIISWIRLVLAIAEFCLTTDKAVSFEGRQQKSSKDNSGKGKGERAILRLLSVLGWNKNKSRGYNGEEFGAEEIPSLPTIAEMKAELRRLAVKYDHQAVGEEYNPFVNMNG